jgi:glycosyltransferase involved in cell wall biosynthesis
MNVALMVITDGRWDYLRDTLRSIDNQCDFEFSNYILVNDSGEDVPSDIATWWFVAGHERRGLAGAIQTGWDALTDDVDYVFHLEDDFTFPQPVPVREMLAALQSHPNLAQVALKRQPWSPQEQLAGNMLDLKPGLVEADGLWFHDNLFTFNPCLYPREITRYGAGLEQELTDKLRADDWRFGYFGGKNDPPRCIHIGHRRSDGYRW